MTDYTAIGSPTRIIQGRHVETLRTGDITLSWCSHHGRCEHRFEYGGKKPLVCLECEKHDH
jgi:hypothetical protein